MNKSDKTVVNTAACLFLFVFLLHCTNILMVLLFLFFLVSSHMILLLLTLWHWIAYTLLLILVSVATLSNFTLVRASRATLTFRPIVFLRRASMALERHIQLFLPAFQMVCQVLIDDQTSVMTYIHFSGLNLATGGPLIPMNNKQLHSTEHICPLLV